MNSSSLNSLSDELLAVIRRRPSAFYSPDQLVKKLRCGKADIIYAVDLLRKTGYEIQEDRQGRYKFISAPDLLLAAEIIYKLKTSFIGKHVYAYKSVQSTNTIASQLADAEAPPGTLVVAESQTRGRGRLGRSWHSPEGQGIYLSIVLYPKIDPVIAPGLSIITAVSLAEAIACYKPKALNIKWPNDCLVNGRKVAGILTELSAERKNVKYIIVGVGINVNQRRRDFPGELSKAASSLRRELKKEIGRVEFLQKFLVIFEKHFRCFEKSGLKSFHKNIIQYSNLIGNKVRLDMSGEIITGRAVDIDANGNLVLDTKHGLRAFNAGEVTVVKGRKKPR